MGRNIDNCILGLKPRQAVAVSAFLITTASTATWGWFSLKATADSALEKAASAERGVANIECLVRQQNDYIFFKKVPSFDCSHK